jgi:hypothetical protein
MLQSIGHHILALFLLEFVPDLPGYWRQVLQPRQTLLGLSSLPAIVGGRGDLQLLESLAHRKRRMLH